MSQVVQPFRSTAVAGGRRLPRDGFSFAADGRVGHRVQRAGKRALDVLVAGVALLLLSPLLVVIAVLIQLDSPGAPIITQERVGRHLQPFRMFKFRSMVAHAESLREALMTLNQAAPPLFKIPDDPRITRAGRVLRRFSLDELPQLLNVLKGDMTLVGPRPPFAEEVAEDFTRQSVRLGVTPGMTGLWQVSGRSDLSYGDMIDLDLGYVRHWSLWLDLEILCRTPAAVMTGRGAR